MANVNRFSILYVIDESARVLGKISAIKVLNDKIEEVNFDIHGRKEKREDVDVIVKKFDSITVHLIDKDIILRIGSRGIKIVSPKRATGMCFETVRSRSVKLNYEFFENVFANLYITTRNIDFKDDALLGDIDLPEFGTSLTRSEMDARFDGIRKRKG